MQKIEALKKLMYLEKNVASPEETRQVAREFADRLSGSAKVAFIGELGSGKTFFIKEMCRALKTVQEATSPTFTLINEYHTPAGELIYHFDFYRIENDAELLNLGGDDFFFGDYLCLIEWADKIAAYLPLPRWEVRLEFVEEQPEQRRITILKISGQESENE
jgi:tRNA threonylcarbamoyladenosine biosynthesis protein TsaE